MFGEKFDLKLIRLVRDNHVLYDHNNAQYMDFNEREVVWQKIGDELKRPAADCKARWINIRDINRRILRKSLSGTGKPGKLYKYDSELAFMRPFYRDILVNQTDFEWAEDNDNDRGEPDDVQDSDYSDEKPIKKSAKNIKKKRKKRKFEDVDASVASPPHAAPETSVATVVSEFDSSDPVDAFLLSIGATLRTFSPYHLNLAKSKIFAIVQEHDLQQIVQKDGDIPMSIDGKVISLI